MRVKNVSTGAVLTLATLLLVGGTAMAKGDGVEQITITGPGLDHQIAISDPITRDRFNTWGGLLRFLDGSVVEENSVGKEALAGPYQVRFFLDVHEWVYEFSFYTVEGSEAGYIVLPEPNADQGFVLPGGWYRSSDAWSEVMSEQLQGTIAPRSGVERSVPSLVGFLLAAVLVAAVAVLVRQKVQSNTQVRRPAGAEWLSGRSNPY